ncbi:MAG: MFS transporter [Candidatus Limnocylindrales bacterium]
MRAKLPVPILRDPAFARLWFIQASTQVGGNMALYALTILVFATTRSNTAVSALVMSFLVPPVLLSAAAGVLVDRLNVRSALIVPNTVRTLLTLGLALAGGNVALLLVLNLGVSLTTVLLSPAEASMIPRIVPKPQLETAMGVFNLTLQASFAVGFAFLGPLLVTIAGPSAVLVVVTAFYAAATLATLGLPTAPPVAIEPGIARRAIREPIRQLREGLSAISGNREVSRPLMHLAAAASLVGVIGVLGPNLAVSLGLDPKDLIVIVLPLGLGVVAGIGGVRWLGRGLARRRAAETGLIMLGLLAAAIAAAGWILRAISVPVIPPVVVLAFCAGAA